MSENNFKQKISVVLTASRDEENIKQIVENYSFADEIIFLVKSNKITAKNNLEAALGIKIIACDFEDLLNQQKYAAEQSRNDWIIFTNDNNSISKELKIEIGALLEKSTSKLTFYVKEDFFFMGKKIKFGGYKNKQKLFLFNKNYFLEPKQQGENITFLKNTICDYEAITFDDYNDKLSLESGLKAKTFYSKNLKPTFYHLLILPIIHFFKHFIIKFGFLDGKEGFILAYINSFATLKCYLQLWLMYRDID